VSGDGSLGAPDRSLSEVEGPPHADDLDLRILTPGLTDEEIAAVTSVVAAMLEEQRDAADRAGAPQSPWNRSLGVLRPSQRGAAAWRWSLS